MFSGLMPWLFLDLLLSGKKKKIQIVELHTCTVQRQKRQKSGTQGPARQFNRDVERVDFSTYNYSNTVIEKWHSLVYNLVTFTNLHVVLLHKGYGEGEWAGEGSYIKAILTTSKWLNEIFM